MFWSTNPYELAAWLPLPLYILIAISAIADRSLGQGPSLVYLASLRTHGKMSCSRYDPLGPVTTGILNGSMQC